MKLELSVLFGAIAAGAVAWQLCLLAIWKNSNDAETLSQPRTADLSILPFGKVFWRYLLVVVIVWLVSACILLVILHLWSQI
jgi:hypothetical protein